MARKSKASVESTEVISGENAIQNKEIEGLSQGQIVRKRFFRHRADYYNCRDGIYCLGL
jgi:peptide/nickel transport system permease protein